MIKLTDEELKMDLPTALAETENAIKALGLLGHPVPEEAYQIRSIMRRAIAAELDRDEVKRQVAAAIQANGEMKSLPNTDRAELFQLRQIHHAFIDCPWIKELRAAIDKMQWRCGTETVFVPSFIRDKIIEACLKASVAIPERKLENQ